MKFSPYDAVRLIEIRTPGLDIDDDLDVPAFEKPFEKEFEYVASLWAVAQSLAEFNACYSREKSDQHDAFY